MMTTILLAIILMAFAMIGLGITILTKKKGKFPETHVGHNIGMKKLGISCALNDKMGCDGKKRHIECTSCHEIG